jgi:hypothetical protein
METRLVQNTICVGLVCVFLLLNLATATVAPPIWQDEVYYTDPAFHFATTGRLSSSAWWHVSTEEFWFGYVQLHEILLGFWIKVLGFSILSVRSINYLYFAVASLALVFAFRRATGSESLLASVGFLTLLFLGDGTSFTYRSGRGDALAILAVSSLAASFCISNRFSRVTLMWISAASLPWTSIPACVAALLTLAAFFRKLPRVEVMRTALAIATGSALLTIYLAWNGVLLKYVMFLAGGQVNVIGRLFQAMLDGGDGSVQAVISDLVRVLSVFHDTDLWDRSYQLLIAMLLSVIALVWKSGDKDSRNALVSLCWGLFLVLAVGLVGEPRKYYLWFGYIPAAAGAALLLVRVQQPGSRQMGAGVLIVSALAAMVGLPMTLLTNQVTADCSPHSLDQFVEGRLSKAGAVYASYPAFYALRSRDIRTYFPSYSTSRFHPDMTPEEKHSVDLMLVQESQIHAATIRLGGDWTLSARSSMRDRSCPYDLVLLQRHRNTDVAQRALR